MGTYEFSAIGTQLSNLTFHTECWFAFVPHDVSEIPKFIPAKNSAPGPMTTLITGGNFTMIFDTAIPAKTHAAVQVWTNLSRIEQAGIITLTYVSISILMIVVFITARRKSNWLQDLKNPTYHTEPKAMPSSRSGDDCCRPSPDAKAAGELVSVIRPPHLKFAGHSREDSSTYLLLPGVQEQDLGTRSASLDAELFDLQHPIDWLEGQHAPAPVIKLADAPKTRW
jgi:hypothetical protein